MTENVDSVDRLVASSQEGVIAHALDEELGLDLEKSGLPVVNFSSNQETIKPAKHRHRSEGRRKDGSQVLLRARLSPVCVLR